MRDDRKTTKRPALIPHYHGAKWISADLPKATVDWSLAGDHSIEPNENGTEPLIATLSNLNRANQWRWPKRRHFFFPDLHADPEAFVASLVASGGIKKYGPEICDFRLSSSGGRANFVIGGDCVDKGPSNLELLRTVHHLKKQGARVRLLAGNHDIRLLFGMRVVGHKKDVRNEHFFIRTGQKIIPLLREIWDSYLKHGEKLRGVPNEAACKKRLFPRSTWFDQFTSIQGADILPAQMEREVAKIAKKMERFERLCGEGGLDLRQVYAAVEKWKSLFLDKEGEFYWFYKNMRLCYQSGSCLFIHAGVDDVVARMLMKDGVGHLNRSFRKAMKDAPCDFYYSALCNTIRTKYREVDRPFTDKGARWINHAGVTAIIHGHRNLHHGQRIAVRNSQINFECDTSLDRHTRRMEKVVGRGAAVTIVDPRGYILGVSSDCPKIKVFHPEETLRKLRAANKGK